MRARYLFVRARLLFKNVRPGRLKKLSLSNKTIDIKQRWGYGTTFTNFSCLEVPEGRDPPLDQPPKKSYPLLEIDMPARMS